MNWKQVFKSTLVGAALIIGVALSPTLAPAFAAGTVFVSRPAGLTFNLPDAWKLDKTRLGWVINVPLSPNAVPARLEIYESEYRQSVERWQDSQRQVNESLKRSVERQWQEEVLGVPMLMTRIRYTQDAKDVTALVALVYTATPKKLNFRLTAPSESFTEAEAAWRGALQSLQTTTGQMPAAEDPTKPLPVPGASLPVVAPANNRPPVIMSGQPDRRRIAPVVVTARAGNQDWELRLPAGWTAEAGAAGWTLKHPQLRGTARIEVNSELDSPQPDDALSNLMAKTLGSYVGVIRRRDEPRTVNRAGALVRQATREGKSETGDRFERGATGARGGAYWMLTYETVDPLVWKSDRTVLDALLNVASVEPRAKP